MEIDAAGRGIRTLSRTPSHPGNNVTLTLDMRLQQVAEIAFGDRRGALVAIDPSNGGVLALVSKPGFDPNLFVDGIDPQYWAELNGSIDKPLTDRAISGLYPPGSTFKPYLALAALETGKRKPSSTIFDPGYFDFGGRRFRDDKKGGHGVVDLYKSITESCDTYYYHLANDMGIDAIARFLAPFGFGTRTGIDIAGESLGVLPSPEWKMKRFKRPADQKWYPGETISVAIGQGPVLTSALQVARAFAGIANADGSLPTPHLFHIGENQRTNLRCITIEAMIAAMRQWQVIPKQVLFDNGGPFRGKLLAAFCQNLGIELIHTSPRHPQTNGKLERAFRDDMPEFYRRSELWDFDILRRDLPAYVEYRNNVRGHWALGGQPSRARLDEQHRMALPWVLEKIEAYARYAWGHKRVTEAGCLRLLSRHLYLDAALAGQRVTCYETLDGFEVRSADQQVYLLPDYRKWLKLAGWKHDWAIPEDLRFEPHEPVACP